MNLINNNKTNLRKVGNNWEQAAGRYLISKGLSVIRYNYYCRYGEIDIIAIDRDYIVFVEVKFRNKLYFGRPEQAVDLKKQKSIRKCASYFICNELKNNGMYFRFDVIGISREDGLDINWIKNAF